MKGILFDFWGTLVDNGVNPSPVKQAKKILGLKMPFKEYIEPFERAYMTEDVDDLYEAFENVCDEFNLEPEERLLDDLVGMQNKSDILAEPYDETFDVLEDLREDYKIALVSNTPPNIHRVLDKFGMKKYFDAIVLSCDTGYLKTDPEMFEIALDKLGLEADEVVHVGDSMETDVKGAEKAGIEPILIDRWSNRSYKNRIEDLTQLKDVLEGLK